MALAKRLQGPVQPSMVMELELEPSMAEAVEVIHGELEGLAGELDGLELEQDPREWVSHLVWLAERIEEIQVLDEATEVYQFSHFVRPLQRGLAAMSRSADEATWIATMVQASQATGIPLPAIEAMRLTLDGKRVKVDGVEALVTEIGGEPVGTKDLWGAALVGVEQGWWEAELLERLPRRPTRAELGLKRPTGDPSVM